jgi:cytochrome c oxidase subunit I+III
MAVSLPSGIQVFAWIATIASGRLRFSTPSLFILGFLFIFTLGGLTGVMVAMVPFDWQVHDTYFVVAHFHYVLVGGMVFPLFAALYYWAPAFSPYPLSERLGRWAFALMFIGFNVAFFTMHITGLLGMPRRIYTYPAELGWGPLNLISTAGAFVFAAGVALVIFDFLRTFRIVYSHSAGNVWNAGTLEWLPNHVYATRSIPIVHSREPLWEQPNLPAEVDAGAYYLPGAPTGGRETIVTSPIEAKPQYVVQMPGPGWAHVAAALFTALCFLSLTIKLVTPAIVFAVLAITGVVAWMWQTDPGPAKGPVDIGGGLKLPVYATGPISHSWWAMIVLLLVAGTLYISYLFSYLFLWTVAPEVWPAATGQVLPSISSPLLSGALLIGSSMLMLFAARALARPGRHWLLPAAIALALTALVALVVMGAFTLARFFAGLLDPVRRATFDNTAILWHYTVAQGLFGLLLVHGFPRLVS